MKTMVTELIGKLPEAGSKAYQLQFRTRATRDLQKALNENDNEAIIAVARRWFHTEAGHRSAILTAARLLESGQPLAAEAWLERIATSPRTKPSRHTATDLQTHAGSNNDCNRST